MGPGERRGVIQGELSTTSREDVCGGKWRGGGRASGVGVKGRGGRCCEVKCGVKYSTERTRGREGVVCLTPVCRMSNLEAVNSTSRRPLTLAQVALAGEETRCPSPCHSMPHRYICVADDVHGTE